MRQCTEVTYIKYCHKFLFTCRISYSIFELQHLLQISNGNPNVQVKIMYDIGCVLSSHLQVHVNCVFKLLKNLRSMTQLLAISFYRQIQDRIFFRGYPYPFLFSIVMVTNLHARYIMNNIKLNWNSNKLYYHVQYNVLNCISRPLPMYAVKSKTFVFVFIKVYILNMLKLLLLFVQFHSQQVQFSPRRLEGFGLTDGEAIERLWAYLRGFSSITREMSANRRIDLLTDALLHLSRKNFKNAGL